MNEYKCPSCGGNLAFDSASQKLKCSFCGSEYELDQFETDAPEQTAGEMQQEQGTDNWNIQSETQWQEGEEEGLRVCSCKSCGGEIVCDETTASSSCPYCGSPIVIEGMLSGMLKPDCIIPFKLDKRAAKEALKKHVNSKKLVPAVFKSDNHIDEVKGIYVPFWLFDAAVFANITYSGERVRTWSDSNYKYTEHNYYEIFRAGGATFDQVPVNCSAKIADDLMESIEPFDYREAVQFKPAYLAGYMADKFDTAADACIQDANARIRRSTEEAFEQTIEGFTSVMPQNSMVNIENGTARYALLPVWVLNTKWKGDTYTFAMNGQTGKFVGDLPVDKDAYKKKILTLTGIIGVIGTALMVLADFMFL